MDYACKAVDNGGLALGVTCSDGVVLGVEKLLPFKMLVPGSNRRIVAADRHAGMAGTGLAPDARQIVARARAECSQYLSFYGDRIPAQIWPIAWRTTCMFTLYWSVRPFGASTLLACKDADGYALYLLEPSGECASYHGNAVGEGKAGGEERDREARAGEDDVRPEAGVKHAARIIAAAHDEKDKEFECELSWICDASGGGSSSGCREAIRAGGRAAKAALEDDDMDV